MIEVLAAVLTYLALGAAVWAAVLVIADKPIDLRKWHGLWLVGLVLLLEVGLIVQFVVGIVLLSTDDREVEAATFIGYHLTNLLIPPIATFWALAERTRWGPVVLVVGALTIPVLIIRLRQVWEAHA